MGPRTRRDAPRHPSALAAGDTQHLALPAGTPEAFALVVEHDGRTRRLELHRHDLRAPAARVRVYEADGTYTTITPPPATTYRGAPDDGPLTAVVANLDGTGLTATVFPPDGDAFGTLPTVSTPARATRCAERA